MMEQTLLAAMALCFACRVGAEMQLIQMSVQPHASCRTVVAGDPCFEKVTWAMKTGVAKHPDWYLPLTTDSSFDDFQRHLHSTARLSDVCPEPCAADIGADDCHTSVQGDACYEKVSWAMQTGVVKHPDWYGGLDKDSSFEDFQLHLHSSARLSSACPKPCLAPEAARVRTSEETEDFTDGGLAARTPHPTMAPGIPCVCNGTCPNFPYYDYDGSGCLEFAEAEAVDSLAGRFDELDADGDGCINESECDAGPENPPTPSACPCGGYTVTGTSVCQTCSGDARRRRNMAGDCSACPTGKFDVDKCDDCMEDDAMYLNQSAVNGATTIFVNKDTDLGAHFLTVGHSITISKCCCESDADHETVTITAAEHQTLDNSYDIAPLSMDFSQFDRVTLTCSSTDGSAYPTSTPCGCGSEICDSGSKCDVSGNGGCGACIPTTPPTPAPTVSAGGDPHLVNLNGEHFDVNHGGEFTLLRIPQNTMKPAEVELKAFVLPEHGKPCTTYITEVELSGGWLDGKVVQVRSYLRSYAENETDKFLGLRVLSHGALAEAPWEKLTQWTDQPYVVSEPQGEKGVRVTVSTAQWHSKKNAGEDVPTVAGQVEIQVQSKWLNSTAVFVMRQDLPRQEHLNLAMRRLSALGRADVGGLLGFDAHPESLEDVTPECQRHRDGLDSDMGPKSRPAWKTRWEKIKAQRGKHDETDAVASLVGNREMMCVCSNGGANAGLAEGVSSEGLIDDAATEGVTVEFQTGRLAEATWD